MSMIGYLLRVKTSELEEYIGNSTLIESRLDAQGDPCLLDIDKKWEGILYVLTGYTLAGLDEAKPPLKWAIFGDHILDEGQDMGYGPAAYRTVAETAEISNALQEIPDEKFRQIFDESGIMAQSDIYPSMPGAESSEAFTYYFEYFKLIKDFYSEAAKNNEAVISFIA